MSVLFPDLSEFQPNADISGIRKQTDVIAARVAYGTRLDKTMPVRITEIRKQNFTVVFWYLFLRATQDINAQVQTVINSLGTLHSGESIVIDWETDGGSMPSIAQRDLAAILFEERYMRPTVIYMNASTANANPITRPLWVASYGAIEPSVKHVAWQCSDGAVGINKLAWAGCGLCDTSIVKTSSGELLTALQSNITPYFIVGPIQEIGNDMKRQEFTTPALDENGNGWIDTNIPFEKFVSLVPYGPAPDRDGYAWNNWYWSVNNTNGQARVEIEGAAAHGIVKFAVVAVD